MSVVGPSQMEARQRTRRNLRQIREIIGFKDVQELMRKIYPIDSPLD